MNTLTSKNNIFIFFELLSHTPPVYPFNRYFFIVISNVFMYLSRNFNIKIKKPVVVLLATKAFDQIYFYFKDCHQREMYLFFIVKTNCPELFMYFLFEKCVTLIHRKREIWMRIGIYRSLTWDRRIYCCFWH